MPVWLLILSALAGVALILGEVAIRLVVSLRKPRKSAIAGELAAAQEKLDRVAEAVTVSSAAVGSDPTTETGVETMKDALRVIDRTVAVPRGETDGSTGFLPQFFTTVTKQNLFLGVGIVLLLVPLLIAGGFSVGFDRAGTGTSQTTAP